MKKASIIQISADPLMSDHLREMNKYFEMSAKKALKTILRILIHQYNIQRLKKQP